MPKYSSLFVIHAALWSKMWKWEDKIRATILNILVIFIKNSPNFTLSISNLLKRIFIFHSRNLHVTSLSYPSSGWLIRQLYCNDYNKCQHYWIFWRLFAIRQNHNNLWDNGSHSLMITWQIPTKASNGESFFYK